MPHSRKFFKVVPAILGLFLMATSALADPAAVAPPGLAEGIGAVELGHTLSGEDLEAQSGAKDIQIDKIAAMFSNASNEAMLVGNSISLDQSTMTNGANTIGPGAFAGMNGVGTVIQNSGNQVVIQSATIVDVVMQ